ncbi:ABC transporter ATP-binding protein [Virgibacillus sp. W0181]|uniref:ABC transporter ATP-binding protein n=1 Tax=Virgibacillus sp. W0181 TaxID=3391581 RepID=UPI003F46AD51
MVAEKLLQKEQPNSTAPLVNVENLSVEFRSKTGNVQAVDGVNFSIHQSETLAILGESGSGKSTVALALMGLLPKPNGHVNRGAIYFQGRNLVDLEESERRKMRGEKMSMVFQDPLSALNPVYTVGFQIGEVLRVHRRMSRSKIKKAVVELMEQVKIPDAKSRIKDYPHQFSGGMQQRVIIAMALALQPKVLIADEPTTALDVTVQAQIMQLLKELQRTEKMGLVLISHDLGVVANHADRVAVMYAGHLVETGKVEEVFRNPAHPYTVGLMESLPTLNKNTSRLVPIKGSPPNLLTPPKGCPFHPRCPIAKDICRQELPELTEVASGRESACHFYKEVLQHG